MLKDLDQATEKAPCGCLFTAWHLKRPWSCRLHQREELIAKGICTPQELAKEARPS